MLDGRVMLRVKLLSLAEEQRIIRRHEQRSTRCLRCSKWRRHHIEEKHPIPGAISGEPQYRWSIVCRENGPRFKGTRPPLYNRLRSHRIFDIRPEIRATQIAYAFLRGQEYEAVERNHLTQPNWNKVFDLIERYGVIMTPDISAREYDRLQDVQLAKLEEWSSTIQIDGIWVVPVPNNP